MIDLWLAAIETHVTSAPGNTDPSAGELWDSVPTRLSEATAADVRSRRVYYDFFEGNDADEPGVRPFFVIEEHGIEWNEINAAQLGSQGGLAASGGISVTYTERAYNSLNPGQPIQTNAEHKASKAYFAKWVGELFQWCAENRFACEAQFNGIHLMEPGIVRTPRKFREPNRPDSDYWWGTWLFKMG